MEEKTERDPWTWTVLRKTAWPNVENELLRTVAPLTLKLLRVACESVYRVPSEFTVVFPTVILPRVAEAAAASIKPELI
jgi:hypothetical protein